MVDKILDNDGKVEAYISWSLLDSKGNLDNHGDFVWIDDCYIAPNLRGNGIIKKLSRMVRKRCLWATDFYFMRYKYNQRINQYKIDKYLKDE